MKNLLLIIIILFLGNSIAYATHNRAGEITYEHLSGFTYKITVTTYTQQSSTDADRCELTINFGDDAFADVQRVNGSSSSCNDGGNGPNGESLGNDVKKNVYEVTHTYPGNGTYVITMEDPNRNKNVCNIFMFKIFILIKYLPPSF